ncbi:hypothetical protein HNP55_000919 [Paucibacter oligotrophus]|uniref:O-antigen/teichoic acid export membrane protein n=1 Tax=Roseateles oligotrophus TaxID=1769250 RepID=A0A840L1T3_9BURK|nr:hypothetical protein [Roseateles oligotrophus]MBB4842424.1 hypothetical protein [Roseateles oligotrophus]
MNRIVRLLSYLGSFLIARSLLFASPLLLASALPADAYAQIEWALATATLGAAVCTLGSGGLVPIVIVGGETTATSLRGIRWHHLLVAGTALATALLLHLTTQDSRLWQVSLLIGVLTLTTLKSIELRSNEHASTSLFVDALLLVSMAALAFVGTRFWPDLGPWLAPIALLTVFGILLVRDLHGDIRDGSWRTPTLRHEWRGAMRAGIPLMLTGALAIMITTSGRAGVGWLLVTQAAADYSVLSRGAALPIVAHQILVVAVFRKLYAATPQALGRLQTTIVALVATSSLLLWWLLPFYDDLLGPAFAQAATAHGGSLLMLLAQAVLWSAIALNDTLNARHGTAGAVLRWSAPSLALIFASSWAVFMVGPASLDRFVLIHSVAMLAFFVCQTSAMWRHGVRTLPMAATACLAFLSLFAFAQFS